MENEEKFISDLVYDEINKECRALSDFINDFITEMVKTEKDNEFLINGYMAVIPRRLENLCDLRKLYEKYSS